MIDYSTTWAAQAALEACRARGCTCTPDIDVRPLQAGMRRCVVTHDRGCEVTTPTDPKGLI